MDTPSLWRNPDFLKLWAGQTISEIGSRITREGLPWIAVLVLGAAPWQMGILGALGGASILTFGLIAGVWVDRLRRRPILLATDLGRAVLLVSVPIAAANHVLGMTQIYTVAALAGILTVFFDVAYQSYLPSLVAGGQLVEGNTKLMLSATTAEIAGPALTGVLVQLITAPVAILFDALSFLFSALMVILIGRPEAPAVRHADQHLREETLSGLRFVWQHPLLRPLGTWSASSFLCMGSFGSLYMLYAIRVLGLPPAMLGIVIAMGGVGGTIGSLFSTAVARRFGVGPVIIGATFLMSAAISLVPLAHGSLVTAVTPLMVQQLFSDAAFAVFMIQTMSLRQAVAPPEVLGRVNAGLHLVSRGIVPIGALLGGFLGTWIGIRPSMVFAAAGMLLSTGWLYWSPLRKLTT